MAQRPSLRRRRLIAALVRLREEAGYTLDDAAEAAGEGMSKTKLSRIESLVSGINGDDTYALAAGLGADEGTVSALVTLARQAKKRGWWHIYNDDVLGTFSDFIELEEDAGTIYEFESDVIPGQLQTEAYASAIIGHAYPRLSSEIVKQRIDLRKERQDRVLDSDGELWVVIDEAALRRPVGGAELMAAQLDHLDYLAAQPRITVQVLPLAITGHPAMGVPFTLITLRDGARYVYLDSITGGAYMEEQIDIDAYDNAWKRLGAMALDFDRSATLIRRIAAEHRSAADDDQAES